MVARPFKIDNMAFACDLQNVKINQAVIVGCTGGKYDDLYATAMVLEDNLKQGRKVADGVRMLIVPATQKVYRRALSGGLIEIFMAAGAIVSAPTCGPCLGGHMGVLAKGERAVATTNRNFIGRMGHIESEVYLAGPAVAAASAIKGRIAHPGEVA